MIVMKNLALNTSVSDASSCCSKENCAVTSSLPRNPSNKMVMIYKTEIRAIFVAAFYKITKMLHYQNYCFSPQIADVAATGFDSVPIKRAYLEAEDFSQ